MSHECPVTIVHKTKSVLPQGSYHNPIYLVESVENGGLWKRRCLAVTRTLRIAHLLLRARFVMTPAPRIKLCVIDGLHDAVRNHMRMILPRSLVSFFYSAVWRKTTKRVVNLDSLHYFQISFKCVC